MSVTFNLPPIDEAEQRLDALFEEAFGSEHPAMQDWVSVKMWLLAARQKIKESPGTTNNRQITPCPCCGEPWNMSRNNACQCVAAFTVVVAAGGVFSTRGAIATTGLFVFVVIGALAPKE